MEHNWFTWLLYGKRKLKRLIRKGPLDELIQFMKDNDNDKNYFVYDSMDRVLSKFNISRYDFNRFLNKDGTFNGNKAVLVSPRIQDFLKQQGIHWEASFSEEELAQASNFRKFTSTWKAKDIAKIGCILTEKLGNDNMTFSDIFDGVEVKSNFMDTFLVKCYSYFTNYGSYCAYFPKWWFDKKFVKKFYGDKMGELLSKIDVLKKNSNMDEYQNIVTSLILQGKLTKDNIDEILEIDGFYIYPKDKFYELIDPFAVINRDILLDENGEILPIVVKNMTPLELTLFKMNLYSYSLFNINDLNDSRMNIDFNKLFRFSKDGKIMLNEIYFNDFKDKVVLVNLFRFLDKQGPDTLEEYDFEKIGISESIFRMFLEICCQRGVGAEIIIKKIMSDKNLLKLEGEEANNLYNVFNSLLDHMTKSNSKELNRFFCDILTQILKNPGNYEEKISQIEDVFIHNDLPEIAKRFLIYKIMYPEFDYEGYHISPTLANSNNFQRDMIIFGDLIRIAAESNNLSLREYMNNIERGNALYSLIQSGEVDIDSLDDKNRKLMNEFLKHLEAVYNQTMAGKKEPVKLSGDMKEDLNMMYQLFGTTSSYDLPDRIVRMFGYYANINSFKQLRDMMDEAVKRADQRGRELARKELILEEGDFLKGIGDATYLYDILQNGSVAKEFLGAGSPGSDSTPLDTDVSRIGKGRKVKTLIDESYSGSYGPVWFVVKNDGRFTMTREEIDEKSTAKCLGKEVFKTDDQWGIRTGFGSTDIDYIIIDPVITKEDKDCLSDEELAAKRRLVTDTKFAIVLNGFYIPVFDKNTGNLLFTPEEYDFLRSKMAGLSRYGMGDFEFSPNLDNVPDYDNNALIADSVSKRFHINHFVEETMAGIGLGFSPTQSENLELGVVDLIDTGSTGRGTNTEVSSDFDFIMRIDVSEDPERIGKAICDGLGLDYDAEMENNHILGSENLRLKGVSIPGLDTPVDIDISIVKKDEMDFYSTDECLKDRLENIRRQDPDKYQRVLDNIIYAKKIMKENDCYKPYHSPDSQGGLGGVGIENWVLQNGGSFTDACRTFVEAATTKDGRVLSFEEFKNNYKIFDFGRNFYGKGYDEFVSNNMTEKGYRAMVKACKKHLSLQDTTTKTRSTSFTDTYEEEKSTRK